MPIDARADGEPNGEERIDSVDRRRVGVRGRGSASALPYPDSSEPATLV